MATSWLKTKVEDAARFYSHNHDLDAFKCIINVLFLECIEEACRRVPEEFRKQLYEGMTGFKEED